MPINLDHLGELERTHSCGELRAGDAGREVVLMGWVAVRRDFGPLTFVDLRDRDGLTQIVFDAEDAPEETRLKYRYLDLRRPYLQRNIRLRHLMVAEIRSYMNEQAFTEIETPILIKSTPEGARDYVVPSRLHHGKFYALPQSPQIFKQLCMIAGLDKYYQIARCFRDEDLRADRQPEFTQLDVEFSFATREQVYRLIEGLLARVFRLVGAELPRTFPRLSYAEALRRYGSDKPDLRFGMELQDLRAAVEGTTFAPFASALEKRGEVKGLVAKGGAHLSRKALDELQEVSKRYGAGAL